MKILLIEDDMELCSSIQDELQKAGYVVDCCNDGETAMIHALNVEYCYDLAVIDRMLPIIDGMTIIKAMRQKDISISVIIVTGMSELNDRIEGLDYGADDYLVKPFHIAELLARIKNSLLLTAKESEVLSAFMNHPQSLIPREQLIYKIWGTDTDIVPGNVDNYISFLRKRLKEIGSICEIKTIYGSGYRLEIKNAG